MLGEELKHLDLAHGFHPNAALDHHQQEGPRIIVEGHGMMVKDIDGKEYLDFRSGLLCCNLGYSNEEVARAAYDQMCRIQFVTNFGDSASEPMIRLADKIASMLPPELDRVLVMNSGSETNEAAMKMARYINRLEGHPEKYKVISRHYAYHGVTTGTVPVTDSAGARDAASPLPPGSLFIAPPYCYRCPYGKEYPSCDMYCAWELERVILREGPDTVAAFIGEPVMQTCGCVAPPKEYWPVIREVCTKYQVVMIVDEVVTAFGRTGRLFGMQNYGVWPDIMTMSKALGAGFYPIGATVVKEELYQRLLRAAPGAGLWHGFTMNGNPVGCAVALKNIELVERYGLVENARVIGERMMEGLNALRRLQIVGDVRGLGLLAAVELVKDNRTKEPLPPDLHASQQLSSLSWERGISLRVSSRLNDVLAAPPLIITAAEMDRALAILTDCLEILQDRILHPAAGSKPARG
jgi:adenosylmethionine-8-amino-7-oxononanoate aminotransferase